MGTTGISYQLGQRKFLHGGVVKPLILLINIFSQSGSQLKLSPYAIALLRIQREHRRTVLRSVVDSLTPHLPRC
jgi:hypothetical protein